MKKYLILSLILLSIVGTAHALTLNLNPNQNTLLGDNGTLHAIEQFTSTTSPADAITQKTYGKTFRLSGQGTGCATFSSNGTLTSTGVACGSGSGGTPAGSNTYLQYNDSSSFGGDSGLTWDKTNKQLTVTGNANSSTIEDITGTIDPSGSSAIGLSVDPLFQPTSASKGFTALSFTSQIAGSQRTGDVVGVLSSPFNTSSGNTFTSTSTGVYGFIFQPLWRSGTVLNMIGYDVASPVNNAASPIGNLYGLLINDLTVGTSTNYAIKTGLGKVSFGDNVGIGTTSPYAALSVVGSTGVVADHFAATSTAAASSTLQNTSVNQLKIGSLSGALTAGSGFVSATPLSTDQILVGTASGFTTATANSASGWPKLDANTNLVNFSVIPRTSSTSDIATIILDEGEIAVATGTPGTETYPTLRIGVGGIAGGLIINTIDYSTSTGNGNYSRGNFGIATSSSLAKLWVNKGGGTAGNLLPRLAGDEIAVFQNSASHGDNAAIAILASGDQGARSTIYLPGRQDSTVWSSGAISYDHTSNYMEFIVNGATSTSMISNGNVGIGDTAPTYKLSVAGIGSFGDYIRSSNFTATSTTKSTFPYASTTMVTSGALVVSSPSTVATTYFSRSIGNLGGKVVFGDDPGTIPASGYNTAIFNFDGALNTIPVGAHGVNATQATAGINTFSSRGTSAVPTASQSDDPIFFLGAKGYGTTDYSSASRAVIQMKTSQIWTDANQGTYITFETTPNNLAARAEAMRLDQSGFLGIGTTSPYAKLSVAGQVVGAYFTATTTTASTLPYASTTMVTATTASTTNLTVSSAGGTAGCATFSTAGLISNTGTACGTGSGSFAFPFDPTNSFNAAANSTSTRLLLTNGLSASTTVNFGNAGVNSFTFDSTNGRLGIGIFAPTDAFDVKGDIGFPVGTLGTTRNIGPTKNALNDTTGGDDLKIFGGSTACFLAGTKVTLADGSQKNIEDITVGDRVLSFDESAHKTVISSVDGVMHHAPSEMLGDYYLIIKTKGGKEIKVTINHLIYSAGKWVQAGELDLGSPLLNENGQADSVASIAEVQGRVPTYNLEINKYHLYFAENILVHNAKGTGLPAGDLILKGGDTDEVNVGASTGKVIIYGGLSGLTGVPSAASTTAVVLAINESGTAVGKVGVATTTPYTLFSIEQGTETSSFWVGNNGSSTPSFTVNGVNGNGFVGVATTSPWTTLSVAGSFAANLVAFATGDSAVCQRGANGQLTVDVGISSCIVSSRTVKHNIENTLFSSALNRILKLNPVSFEYNGTNKSDLGLIAEDVATVDARYAQYNQKGEPRAINWSAIQSDLIKTIQSIIARVSGLEKKVNEQDKKIKSLEDRLSKLEKK